MRPREHLIYGSLASAALYPAIGADAVFFWGASIAIDIDHYGDYIYRNGFRDFSVRKMFGYHAAMESFWRSPEFLNVEVFHSAEFMVPFYIIARLTGSTALMAVFWGFLFHIVLDMVFLWRLKIFSNRAHSFAEYFLRKRAMERNGLYPSRVYSEAIRMADSPDYRG
ncbi:MAG: hypothetical protein HY893_04540 [Deltaproteobacteria bacterium]|nr:hypothetical protein [Deltaproteobacteria bacterium]